MKKVMMATAFILASFVSFSQTSKKTCYLMKDGKVMVVKSGKEMMMEKTMTLSNGEMVMKDGTVKMKDGSTTLLKEGQYVDMNGKMGMMGDMKMEKMKMDSTK